MIILTPSCSSPSLPYTLSKVSIGREEEDASAVMRSVWEWAPLLAGWRNGPSAW